MRIIFYKAIFLNVLFVLSFSINTYSSYPWPLIEFDQHHPVLATLGENRITGSWHFHEGIDIDAVGDESNVFPVISGTVKSFFYEAGNQEDSFVRVDDGAGNRYYYYHINPSVNVDDPVTVSVSTIGIVMLWGDNSHLHLQEGDDGNLNPLRSSNGISPYVDTSSPVVYNVEYFIDSTTNSNIESSNEQLEGTLYGKLDILSHAKDIQNDGGSQNVGVYRIDYQIKDSADNTILGPIENLKFDSVENGKVGLVYSSFTGHVSNNSTFYYWVTNTQTEDKYWNTKLRKNEQWNGSNALIPDPSSSYGPQYQDGKYTAWVLAYDIKGNGGDMTSTPPKGAEDEEITIDNFRPYVKKVQIDGQTIKEWTFDGTHLNASTNNIGIGTGGHSIIIEFSEPMSTATVSIISYGVISLTSTQPEYNHTVFTGNFTIPSGATGQKTLTIDGYDLAGNRILEVINTDTEIDPQTDLTRNSNGDMLPLSGGGSDTGSFFSIDTTSPTIIIQSPSEKQVYKNAMLPGYQITANITINDVQPGSGINENTIAVSVSGEQDGTSGTLTKNGTPSEGYTVTYSCHLKYINYGKHIISVTASDIAGNSTTKTGTFYVFPPLPELGGTYIESQRDNVGKVYNPVEDWKQKCHGTTISPGQAPGGSLGISFGQYLIISGNCEYTSNEVTFNFANTSIFPYKEGEVIHSYIGATAGLTLYAFSYDGEQLASIGSIDGHYHSTSIEGVYDILNPGELNIGNKLDELSIDPIIVGYLGYYITTNIVNAQSFDIQVAGLDLKDYYPTQSNTTTPGNGHGQTEKPNDTKEGSILIADTGNNRVQILTDSGTYVSEISVSSPISVVKDSYSNYYVSDSASNKVKKYSNNGAFLYDIGDFTAISKLIINNNETENLYVLDKGTGTIKVYNLSGTLLGTIGSGLNNPEGIGNDLQGNIYITDTGNNKVIVYNSAGSILKEFGQYGKEPGNFDNPKGICTDSEGNIYVADAGNNSIDIFSSTGIFKCKIGFNGTNGYNFNNPEGVCFSRKTGKLYVADTGNDRVAEFEYTQPYFSNPPIAKITSPIRKIIMIEDMNDKKLQVSGTAKATILDYNGWSLSYGAGTNPTTWINIVNSTVNIKNDVLANWDLTNVPQGVYTIRLSVPYTANILGQDVTKTVEDKVLLAIPDWSTIKDSFEETVDNIFWLNEFPQISSYPWTITTSRQGSVECITSDFHSNGHSMKLSLPQTNSSCWFISPQVDLANCTKAGLKFWHKYYMPKNSSNLVTAQGTVYISVNNGVTWELIHPVKGYPEIDYYPINDKYTGNVSSWEQEVYDLSHFAGSKINIKFIANSNQYLTESCYWLIDDVEIGKDVDINPVDYTASVNELVDDVSWSRTDWVMGSLNTSWHQYQDGVGTLYWKVASDLNKKEYLYSPKINLTDTTFASLIFYNLYQSLDVNNDGGRVEISADNGYTWNVIYPVGDYPQMNISNLDNGPGYSGSIYSEPKALFNISQYCGNFVNLRFYFASNSQNGFWSFRKAKVVKTRLLIDNVDSTTETTFTQNNISTTSWVISSNDNCTQNNPVTPSYSWKANNISNSDIKLNSKIINLFGATSATLKFWHKYQFPNYSGYGQSYGYVEMSVDNGTSWFKINPVNGYPSNERYENTLTDWTQEQFNLNGYVNDCIRVRFRCVRPGGTEGMSDSYWYIDNVQLGINDTMPPRTTIAFTGPQNTIGSTLYVNNLTSSTLNSIDDCSSVNDAVGLGLESLKYQVTYDQEQYNPNGWITYNEPVVISSEGPHKIYYYGKDIVSNSETIKSTEVVCDMTAPSAIQDLSILSANNNSVVLHWSAPGNNGTNGNIINGKWRIDYSTFTSYEFKVSNYKIEIATDCIPSDIQNYIVKGLQSGLTYYFVIWSADNLPNWSEISNIATSYVQQAEAWDSVKNGNWDDPTVWDIGIIPENGSKIQIQNNVIYCLPVDGVIYSDISIKNSGKLQFDAGVGSRTLITAGDITIESGGSLLIPANTGYMSSIKIKSDFNCQRGLKVDNGGTLDISGEAVIPLMTALAAGVNTNDSVITANNTVNWKPGDILLVPASDADPGHTEKRILSSINNYQLTLSSGFDFAHSSGTEIINISRRCLITAYDSNSMYIENSSTDKTKFKLTGVEISNAGDNTPNGYGVVFNTSKGIIEGSSFHDSGGVKVTGSSENTFTDNLFYGLDKGLFLSGSVNNNISSNSFICAGTRINDNYSGNIFAGNLCVSDSMLTISNSRKNIIKGNKLRSSSYIFVNNPTPGNNIIKGNEISYSPYGIVLYFYAWDELVYDNEISNCGEGIAAVSSNVLLLKNRCHDNGIGIELWRSQSTLYGNELYSNSNYGIFVSSGATLNKAFGCILGAGGNNVNGDIGFNGSVGLLEMRECSMLSSVFVDTGSMIHPSSYLVSYNQNGYGTGKINMWGHVYFSSLTCNYSDMLYNSGVVRTFSYVSDSNNTISQITTDNAYTKTELWEITCISTAPVTIFNVMRGSGTLENDTSGGQCGIGNYTSADRGVSFNISQGNYSVGDVFYFVTESQSGDVNHQKTLEFGDSEIGTKLSTWNKLEMKGSPEYPTIATGTASNVYYAVNVYGKIDISNYVFNNLNSTGVYVHWGADVIDLSSGTFDNIEDSQGSSSYISVASITSNGEFYGCRFDDSGNTADYNIKADGADGIFWYFTGWSGVRGGEGNDLEIGGAAILWDEDYIAPAYVSNCMAMPASFSPGGISLSWNATGDNGTDGTIVGLFEIKYSSAGIITAENYNNPPAPTYTIEISTTYVIALSTQVYNISNDIAGLIPGTSYWFAIKTKDYSNNWSLWYSSADISSVNTGAYAFAAGAPNPPYTVTNTKDSGIGSLRWAMTNANSNPGNTITFNIPTIDDGYSSGVWTIRPLTPLPQITGAGTYINGSSQKAYIGGDPNQYGPEIEICGGAINWYTGDAQWGLHLNASNITIENLVISSFTRQAITLEGNNGNNTGCTIKGCYIGTDSQGMIAKPNAYMLSGDWVVSIQGNNNTFGGPSPADRNIVSGNKGDGSTLSIGGTSITVRNNYIGVDRTGKAALANAGPGVATSGCFGSYCVIQDNIISGNSSDGIDLKGCDGFRTATTVTGNLIGCGLDNTKIPNTGAGIYIYDSNSSSHTITNNDIAFNDGKGITIENYSTTTGIKISSNSIRNNGGLGIDLGNNNVGNPGINRGIASPWIMGATITANTTVIDGTAPVNSLVEIFVATISTNYMNYGQGLRLMGVSQADGTTGKWSFSVSSYVVSGDSITATATSTNNDTSEFSLNKFISKMETPYVVTNTADSGSGSLRHAIENANRGQGQVISFNIPTTDAGYNETNGAFYIRPSTPLPDITGYGTVIDGSTQKENKGDTNTSGPEICLSGINITWTKNANNNSGGTNGICITTGNVTIKGLVISSFTQAGIYIKGNLAAGYNIKGCYIGIDPTGSSDLGNGMMGILMDGGCGGGTIGGGADERNVISGNDAPNNGAIQLCGSMSSSVTIMGNYIGTDKDGTTRIGNSRGIDIDGSRGHLIEGNVISGNDANLMFIGGTSSITVKSNYIGTDKNGTAGLNVSGTYSGAIFMWGTVTDIRIIDNVIGYSKGDGYSGISVANADGNERITIRGNSMFSHGCMGIDLGLNNYGPGIANNGIKDPWITNAKTGVIQGTAPANCIVEVFKSSVSALTGLDYLNYGQGILYLGSTTADGSGNWSCYVNESYLALGDSVTATATDAQGDTSEFAKNSPVTGYGSAGIGTGENASVDLMFRLGEIYAYPNPSEGKDKVTLHIECGVADTINIKIFTLTGELIHRGEITNARTKWVEKNGKSCYEYEWDVSGIASGIYIYTIDCTNEEYKNKLIRVHKKLTIIR